MKEKIYLSSDHAGCKLKNNVKKYLEDKGYEIVDLGTNNETESVSYAEFGKKLAESVLNTPNSYGIGFCGTGLGISYSVNRYKGIRGARVTSVEDAELAKKHNNANILLLGGRQMSKFKTKRIINKFFSTKYEGGRHQNRIDELDK